MPAATACRSRASTAWRSRSMLPASACCWWPRSTCRARSGSIAAPRRTWRGSGGEKQSAAGRIRPEVAAGLAATVAMHGDPRDCANTLDALPNEARQILQGRRPQRVDVVEELVIERATQLRDLPLEQTSVDDHS